MQSDTVVFRLIAQLSRFEMSIQMDASQKAHPMECHFQINLTTFTIHKYHNFTRN